MMLHTLITPGLDVLMRFVLKSAGSAHEKIKVYLNWVFSLL